MEYERIQKPPSLSATVGRGGSRLPTSAASCSFESTRSGKGTTRMSSPPTTAEKVFRSDSCRDVNIVTSVPDCSTSSEMAGGLRKDFLEADGVSSSAFFEFHKAERPSHRPPVVPPFSKPAPSKWDDAHKWIASPTSNRSGKAPSQARKVAAAARILIDVAQLPQTKTVDPTQGWGAKSVNWVPDVYPLTVDSHANPLLFITSPVPDSAVNLSQHGSSTSVQTATAFVSSPPTVRSVSMRDMGTEMTPIPSQDPSRNGTPVRATTPIRSPTTSKPCSPGRTVSSDLDHSIDCHMEDRGEMSEIELKMKTRREIMILGTKLGKPSIAAWASKEQDQDVPFSLRTAHMDPPEKKAIEMRAAAWEEAEKAKYLARFKREEVKIQAWENHQKAKSGAEMRKVEVEVERIRAHAHDKLMNKLAAARHKADEKRSKAEAKRHQQEREGQRTCQN